MRLSDTCPISDPAMTGLIWGLIAGAVVLICGCCCYCCCCRKKKKKDRPTTGEQVIPNTNTLYSQYIDHFDGLVKERRNSIANALELRLSCTNL